MHVWPQLTILPQMTLRAVMVKSTLSSTNTGLEMEKVNNDEIS